MSGHKGKVEQANQADKQPRGKFGGIMKVGPAWLLAAYRQRWHDKLHQFLNKARQVLSEGCHTGDQVPSSFDEDYSAPESDRQDTRLVSAGWS